MKRNREEMAAASYIDTLPELQATPGEQDYGQVSEGSQVLLDNRSQEPRRALRSQLSWPVMHVIKWKTQPKKRTAGWAVSILDARKNIEEIMAKKPGLNRQFLDEIWEKTRRQALRKAQEETQTRAQIDTLTWLA